MRNGSRSFVPVLTAMFTVVVLGTTPLRPIAGAQQSTPTNTASTASADASKVGKYNGPGACAASNCHGGVQPKTLTRIAQNEYSIWAAGDKHAIAYRVLSSPTSIRIGKTLKLPQAPTASPRCLACHALDVDPQLRATTFKLDDGVSCENCHGPAVGWLGPHTTKNWKHEDSIKLGMYDTRDIVKRSERCLTCHVGTSDKQVDHELIAAGHPDLRFELESYSASMPRHWKLTSDKDPWETVQEWAVGQAVQVRERLARLNRRASSPTWPEYAELQCFACHHSLTKPEDSWRQARGYSDRRPGSTPWNPAGFVVFRHAAIQIDPTTGKELDTQMARIEELVAAHPSAQNGQEIAQAASRAEEMADRIAVRMRTQQFDADLTLGLLQSIAADTRTLATEDERSAEQAAMALDSLSLSYARNVRNGARPELRAAISSLFQQLQNPSAYNAPKFAAQVDKVRALLPQPRKATSASNR